MSGLFSAARLRAFSHISQDCALCDAPTTTPLCAPCRNELPALDPSHCVQCATEVAGLAPLARCGQCISHPPSFDRAVVAFRYAFPLDRLVQALKFSANFSMVEVLTDELIARLQVARASPHPVVDRVIPLPLAHARLAARGFNQSALIAERIAHALRLPLDRGSMLKVRDTPPQSGLNREARLKNVKGAFAAEGDVRGKRIALVDDVITTGATLSEAAKVLKNAGALSVDVWVVARAQLARAK